MSKADCLLLDGSGPVSNSEARALASEPNRFLAKDQWPRFGERPLGMKPGFVLPFKPCRLPQAPPLKMKLEPQQLLVCLSE